MTIKNNLQQIQENITEAALKYHRDPHAIHLLAVSKTQSCENILKAYAAGQRAFGENYLQEAMNKIVTLKHQQDLEWHFIGPLQSNKTKSIAENFNWVHSVERYKTARLLNEHRSVESAPLNVCIQINVSNEASKSGVSLTQLFDLVNSILQLPRLKLRGLMTIPAITTDFEQQRRYFRALKEAQDKLNRELNLQLDTLSMGMSDDYVAAIAEGATIIRLGTAIFGTRETTSRSHII